MYVNSKKIGSSEELVVYANPTSSDIKEIVKASIGTESKGQELRFSIDGLGKKVYAWDAYCGTHPDAENLAGLSEESKKNLYFFQGYAVINSSRDWKTSYIHSNFYKCIKQVIDNPSIISEFDDSKWVWVDNYLPEFTNRLADKRVELDIFLRVTR